MVLRLYKTWNIASGTTEAKINSSCNFFGAVNGLNRAVVAK
jgi:hypothetical protein